MRIFLSKKEKKGIGFTLIELLIYVSVLVLIVLAAGSIFLSASKSSRKAKAARETIDNTRRAIEVMTHEIREAKSIYTPTSVLSSSNGQLSLETTKYCPEGEISTYIDFYLCEQRLCLKKESQNPIAITSDRVKIENLEFYQIATSSIQISLKVNYKSLSTRPEDQFSINTTSTVSLRVY